MLAILPLLLFARWVIAGFCPGSQTTCSLGNMKVYDRVDVDGFLVITEPPMNHGDAVKACRRFGLSCAELSWCTAATASRIIVEAFGQPQDVWCGCSGLAYYSGEATGCGAIAAPEPREITRPAICQRMPPPPCQKSGESSPSESVLAEWRAMFKYA